MSSELLPRRSPLVALVDDDEDMRALLERWLTAAGYRVDAYADAEAVLAGLSGSAPECALVDLQLPGRDGMSVLAELRRRFPRLPVLILTANRDVDVAVKAMHEGAFDYLTKPVDRARLTTTVRNAIERYQLTRQVAHLQREVQEGGYSGMLGRSPAMHRLFAEVERVAASDVTVLIGGESGSGKELVSRAIHDNSRRKSGPFVALNCAALPESLQESELFGHEKGAFTGAVALRRGRFEEAHEGTLFLDEVAELSLPLQAKLLRVLQERTFRRLGGGNEIRSDFRLVAASHISLADKVAAGGFREDLFFRLAVFELEVPALRHRTGDVRLLAERFLREFAPDRDVRLTAEATATLEAHEWPGNVRELQNAIQRALVVSRDDLIRAEDLPTRLQASPRIAKASPAKRLVDARGGTLREVERRLIEQALERAKGNVADVVRELGMGRTTIYRKLKAYGIRRSG